MTVWFGTREHMQWIPAPAVDMSAGKSGFSGAANFTNGGAWVRRSKAAAKTYSMAWNMKRREDIQPILDFADGIYGNGPIYWCDPFAMDRNMLPAYWATPAQNYYDGPVTVDEARPGLVTLGATTNGYPVEAAVYSLASDSRVPSIFIPIPSGHTAHVGAHGSVSSGSGSIRVIPELSATASGTPEDLEFLSTATMTRFNATYSGDDYIGITVTMHTDSLASLLLNGLMVQVLPNGAVPATGGFISGQGTSGLSFVNQPAVSAYSAALDKVGVSVDLIETEAWTWR